MFAAALSLAGVVVGARLTDRDDELWLEVARAGVQVVAVSLIGGSVAAAWKYFEQIREKKRELREQQLAVFRKIVESYNEVKAIRRTLSSLGFRQATGAMTDRQIAGFRDLMLRLNDVQLEFEAVGRELGETDYFRDDTAKIVEGINEIESHLNDVLQVWEKQGSTIEVGTKSNIVVSGLAGLIGNPDLFKNGVVIPRRKITKLIHAQLFGPASSSTQQELKKLDEHEDKNLDS